MNQELLFSNELEQEVFYEVSQEQKIVTRIAYKKGDVLNTLFNEIKKLKTELKILQLKQISVAESALIDVWDNEYDERWNQY